MDLFLDLIVKLTMMKDFVVMDLLEELSLDFELRTKKTASKMNDLTLKIRQDLALKRTLNL
jgi:hypothetical protein